MKSNYQSYLLILLAIWLIHDSVGLSDTQKQSINSILDNADVRNAELMVNISWAESRLIPSKLGIRDKRDSGLFQYSTIWAKDGLDNLLNPAYAARKANEDINIGSLWKWSASSCAKRPEYGQCWGNKPIIEITKI